MRDAIESLTERGELARAGISDLEIGYSARSAHEWDQLSPALEAFELVEMTTSSDRREPPPYDLAQPTPTFQRLISALGASLHSEASPLSTHFWPAT